LNVTPFVDGFLGLVSPSEIPSVIRKVAKFRLSGWISTIYQANYLGSYILLGSNWA